MNINGKIQPTKEKNSPLFSFISKAILFLLFFAGLNFLNKFFYFVFAAFFICIFLKNTTIKVASNTIWFFFFSISLLVFWTASHGSITALLRCFTYLLCYIIGQNLFSENDDLPKTEKKVQKIYILLSFGPLLHMLLNFLTNADKDEYVRNTVDFWTNNETAATGQAALGCMTVAVAIALIFSRFSIKYKIFAFVTLGIVIAYNLVLAGRTLLFMIIITFFVALFYYLKHFPLMSNFIKICFLIGVTLIVLLLLYGTNAFGIRDSFEASNFYTRFFGEKYNDLNMDSRNDFKLQYLKFLFVFPWGGNKIHEAVGTYAHDLYLDTYDEAGVFAFIFVVIIAVGSIMKLFRVLKIKSISFETKQLLLCLYIVMHLEFFIEPILAGVPWFFALFCIVYGTVSYLEHVAIKQERARL